MSQTTVADLNEQAQKFWSPRFMSALKEDTLLAGLVNKEYQGDLKQKGDTVYVSQIEKPQGQLKTIGVDADTFATEKLTTNRVAIVANKRAVAAYEFEDLVEVQTMIQSNDPQVQAGLFEAIQEQINDYLYSLVAPSTSTKRGNNLVITGVSDFNASQIATLRRLAAQEYWEKSKGWWILADPQYYSDILNAQTLTSQDFVPGDTPVLGGQIVKQRFGFNIVEDSSRDTDNALCFHPDWLGLVMGQPRVKISDLHAQKQFGFVMSVDVVFGAKILNQGDEKHISISN